MDKFLLRIFRHEVERQCTFALIAYDDLVGALKRGEMDRLWYSAQALLVAVGNISKLLWPSNPRLAKRGNQLRTSLSIRGGSVLAPRNFRNHIENNRYAYRNKGTVQVDPNYPQNVALVAGTNTRFFFYDNKDYARSNDPYGGLHRHIVIHNTLQLTYGVMP